MLQVLQKTSGAAGLRLTKKNYIVLKWYIKSRGLQDKDKVFARTSGISDSSFINHCLKKALTEFGSQVGEQVPDITCTLIRKTLVSISREMAISSQEEMDMARHMDHSVDTANKHYNTSKGTIYSRLIMANFIETKEEEAPPMTFL